MSHPQPLLIDDRQLWYDGRRIPMLRWESVYTDERSETPCQHGFIAQLPTENGAIVSFAYDPTNGYLNEPTTSLFLYVLHDTCMIDAKIETVIYAKEIETIVYDPDCLGDSCAGCEHGFGRWWEYVHSAEELMGRLAWLGTLPVKQLTKG